ncbi:MAG: hypothetical protein ABSE95_15620 [Thermodesulfobacteriota bacterium]
MHPEGPEPPPRDIIEEEVWRTIVSLPDDVSIRTSNDYGTEIKAMNDLWVSVIDMCVETKDAWYHAVLDMAEGLQASTFNALCGYYRVAASCLRATLEVIIAGVYLQLERSVEDAILWQKGQLEIKFGFGCDHLSRNTRIHQLESHLEREMQYSIFRQRQQGSDPGWARWLFGELSNYAHARPTHSEGSLWEGSNGPIFVPSSFRRTYAHYLDVCALLYLGAKLCRPHMKFPEPAKWLFHSHKIRPSLVSVRCFEYLLNETNKSEKEEAT